MRQVEEWRALHLPKEVRLLVGAQHRFVLPRSIQLAGSIVVVVAAIVALLDLATRIARMGASAAGAGSGATGW